MTQQQDMNVHFHRELNELERTVLGSSIGPNTWLRWPSRR
jgi:hypothetical protein